MPHQRRAIRLKVAEKLTGLTTTGTKVYPSRAKRMTPKTMPGLCIYVEQDDAQRVGMGEQGQIADRRLVLIVEGHAQAEEDVDDVLDAMSLEVEAAMASNRTMDGTCRDLEHSRTELGFDGEGDEQAAIVRLFYSVDFTVNENNPDSAV